ncbi:MAG: hypothetical protein FWD71_01335 [Oscillospiraceae bacterium]|nr:hypothetical protein [Oscillospiraceae bacterium]
MIKSFPFAGIFTGYDENGFPRSDRDYSEEDLARYVSDIFSDGVLEHGNNALMVTSNGGMSVRINYGAINIRGRHGYIYEEPEYLTLDPGDDLPRIDLVAMRLDTSIEVRAITPVVIRGTPSADPVMPVLTRNNIIYDMVLASVYIPDDVYSITQDDITDIRKDEDLCGTVYRIGKTRRNIGDIFIQSYPSANPNDLLCDGRYYDPTVYPDLHAKLSTLGLYNPNQWIMNQITPEFAGSSINGV